MQRLRIAAVLLACLASVAIFAAEPTPAFPGPIPIPAGAQASPQFDPQAATDAYLNLIPPAARARSDAYFEGGYWLILWDFLYGALLALIILKFGLSSAMRNLAERITRFGPLRTMIYWTEYSVVIAILGFPLTVYEGYFREHQYGLATQTFGPWMGDQAKFLLVNIVFGAFLTAALFGIVRKLPRTWWVWGALVTFIFLIIGQLLAPVYLVPLFNKVKLLEDKKVLDPILRLARANSIPAKDVYEIDASKQTTRMSANVSGFGSTMRITLNDNLIRRASPEEVQAVMGHEMGHYVLNHVYKGLLEYAVIIFVWFAALRWSLDWALARWGERWKIRGLGDTAILPLVVLVSSIFFFILTPVLNTMVRTAEREADMYGINASRQPDGFAQAAIHLSEYRKMSPGPVEEWIFFDHPSGRNRVRAAMNWKAENLATTSAAK
jgi:STE24 endopeptidase